MGVGVGVGAGVRGGDAFRCVSLIGSFPFNVQFDTRLGGNEITSDLRDSSGNGENKNKKKKTSEQSLREVTNLFNWPASYGTAKVMRYFTPKTSVTLGPLYFEKRKTNKNKRKREREREREREPRIFTCFENHWRHLERNY